MTVNDVYEYYERNWSNVCRQLKMGVNTYQRWVKKGYIPMPTQIRIEKSTNGDLVADVNKQKE